MRKENEIKALIQALKKDVEMIRENPSHWGDEEVRKNMIKQNNHRIHTLEWVLGKHDRFD